MRFCGQLPDPGIPFGAIAAGIGNVGTAQVIGLGASDGLPYLIVGTEYSSFPLAGCDDQGIWHWYGRLPVPDGVQFNAIATGYGNDWNLQVVTLGASDGLPYLTYQVSSSGTWYWYGQLPTQ